MDILVKADQVLPILYGLNVEYGKKYCFPGQKRILSLLEDFRDLKISIATINRWLRVLEDAEYIKRKRRTREDKKLGKVFQSTMYTILKKGYSRLARLKDGVWDWFNSINGNGWKGKKGSKETPKKYSPDQVDQKVRDLVVGAVKKPIY